MAESTFNILGNNFVLELQPLEDICSDPTATEGYCLSDMTDWSINLKGGFVS